MTDQDKKLMDEIQHIFDSGANEKRVFDFVKRWMDQNPEIWRYDFGYEDGYTDGSHGKPNSLEERKKPAKPQYGLL